MAEKLMSKTITIPSFNKDTGERGTHSVEIIAYRYPDGSFTVELDLPLIPAYMKHPCKSEEDAYALLTDLTNKLVNKVILYQMGIDTIVSTMEDNAHVDPN